jgi:hypothetical protein
MRHIYEVTTIFNGIIIEAPLFLTKNSAKNYVKKITENSKKIETSIRLRKVYK